MTRYGIIIHVSHTNWLLLLFLLCFMLNEREKNGCAVFFFLSRFVCLSLSRRFICELEVAFILAIETLLIHILRNDLKCAKA